MDVCTDYLTDLAPCVLDYISENENILWFWCMLILCLILERFSSITRTQLGSSSKLQLNAVQQLKSNLDLDWLLVLS